MFKTLHCSGSAIGTIIALLQRSYLKIYIAPAVPMFKKLHCSGGDIGTIIALLRRSYLKNIYCSSGANVKIIWTPQKNCTLPAEPMLKELYCSGGAILKKYIVPVEPMLKILHCFCRVNVQTSCTAPAEPLLKKLHCSTRATWKIRLLQWGFMIYIYIAPVFQHSYNCGAITSTIVNGHFISKEAFKLQVFLEPMGPAAQKNIQLMLTSM